MFGNFDVLHVSGFAKIISSAKLEYIVSSAQSAVFELVQGSSCHVKRSIFSHIWPSMHFRPSVSTSFNYFPVLFDWPLTLSLQDKKKQLSSLFVNTSFWEVIWIWITYSKFFPTLRS